MMNRVKVTALALASLSLVACGGAVDEKTSVSNANDLRASWSRSAATAYVVHGINGKDLGAPEALPVDVELNGQCALTSLKFRNIVGPISLPPGKYDVKVKLAAAKPCSGPTAISAPGLKLEPGSNLSIVAHLADAETPTPTASVFANDASRAPGKARVVARHAANFGKVDVLVNGAVAFSGLANGQQRAADLKRGSYAIAIAPAGTSTKVFDKTLKLKPGKAYTAYAVGTPANGTFEVLLQVTSLARQPDGDTDDQDGDTDDQNG